MAENRIEKLDPNMRGAQGGEAIEWVDLRELTIEGRGWSDTESFYDRLPARAKGVVREPVWQLAECSAGIAGRFVTDAPAIWARWKLRREALSMNHMPSTGVSGIDLYARQGRRWHWMGVGREVAFPQSVSKLAEKLLAGEKQCMIYLPLYNGVERVEIGVPEGCWIKPDPRACGECRPICFYGSSIVQGGCASRPGMAYPAIIGRRLDRATINLGFSGNARMEKEVAELLAELDPSVYVIDALPNMAGDPIEARVEYLVKALRARHPKTPLVFVENIVYSGAVFNADQERAYRRKNEAQNRALDALSGVDGIHRIACDDLLGRDGEGTVDGTHPTDLGFERMAGVIGGALGKIRMKDER